MPLSKFLNNKQEQAPVNAAGASSVYNPFAKLLEDNFMLNKKVQSETLDFLSSETGVSNKPLQLDASKYADYGVYINDIDTESELNKERANNQSALEQTGNALVQAVGSEVILGSLRSFSDIVDAGVELFSGDKDFTNPVSGFFESLQEDIREKFEIYQENPNDTWNISDYAWWTSNAVSIASTLSLAIPGGAITKGLGLLAKSLNATNKLAKGLSLVSKVPNLRAKQIEAASDLLTHVALMRTAEGYIEARDTFNQVQDEIANKLSKMSPEDKAKLIEHNPAFAGLTDEEIAAKAAGDSAEDVFKDDFWLMLMDAWQLKGLRNISKGFRNVTTTAGIRESQRKSIDALVGRTSAPSTGLKNYFKNLDASNIKVIGAELSEGFEEAYQYIQQQEGIDKARKIIEPNYKARGYSEYLTDSHMWEQAFWGWLGGVAFQGLNSAANVVAAKTISKNEDVTTKRRKKEIEGRISLLNDFNNNIRMLRDEMKNPFIDSNPEINEEEQTALIEYAFEKLVTDMTINAAKVGNFDLLKEFFQSGEFQEHMDKLGVLETPEEKQYIADIVKHMDEVYDVFEGEVNHIISNDVVNQGTIQKLASDNTYLKLASRAAQKAMDKYNDLINESRKRFADNKDALELIDEAEKSIKLGAYKVQIATLNKEIEKADADLKAKKINRAQHTAIVRDARKAKQALYKDLGFSTNEVVSDSEFAAYYDDNYKQEAVQNIDYLDNNANEAIYNKVYQGLNKTLYYDRHIANSKEQIHSNATLFEEAFDALRQKRLDDALAALDDIYENNDVDTVIDYIYGNKNANLTDEVKSAVDKAIGDIKVYDESDSTVANIIVSAGERKAKEKGKRPVATVNGNSVKTPPKVETPPAPKKEEKRGLEGTQPLSPTGGQPLADLGLVESGTEVDRAKEDEAKLAAQRRQAELNNAEDVGSKLSNDTVEFIKENIQKDEFKSLSAAEKIETIKEHLRHKGYKEADIQDTKKNGIVGWVKQIERNLSSRRSAIDLDSLTKEDILANSVLGINNEEEFFEKAIKGFRENNKVLKIGGKYYFNMISFLRYIAESNEILTFEGLKAVNDAFYAYISEHEDKYTLANKYKVNDATINSIIENIDLAPVDVDNRAAVLAKKDQGPLFDLAVHDVKPGDELRIVVDYGGIQFWKTIEITPGKKVDVMVAFNKFATKGKYNNSYLVKSGNRTYNIWQSSDGEYHSDLDEIFDEILADEPSEAALEFLDYLLNDSLTKENVKDFWNNSISKKLLETITNKTPTYENAKDVLDSIKRLYNYDRSADHFYKRESIRQWFRKQYNNYKFTDNLRNVKTVTVGYISHGKALPSETHNEIDKAIVNFNLADHHLGYVENERVIDKYDGSELQAPGFRHRGLVVIVPNGVNAAHYAKIIPQQVDYSKGFGKAVRDEITDIINRHINGEDRFEDTRDKFMSIFNYSGFVSDVLCTENNGRVIISTIDNTLPIITIYKKQADGVTDSTGVAINLGNKTSDAVGFLHLNDANKDLIEKGLDKLLAYTTYALSYDFIDGSPTANPYVKKDGNKLTINMGGKTFEYENYLDFIVKNKVGKINLAKKDLGYGRETNFMPSEDDYRGNINIRVEVPTRQTPRREDNIDALIAEIAAKPNSTSKNRSTRKLIETVIPSYKDSNLLSEEKFISDKVDIVMEEKLDNNNNKIRAEYNTKTKKITLYKSFFDDAKKNETSGMRILVHENIHRAINEIDNPFKREEFVDGLKEIRDIFLDALTSGTSRNEKVVEYLQSVNINPEEAIKRFRDIFSSSDELYNLEEFIAESLTSKTLQGVLNNIESSKDVKVQTEKLSLWQRIIQAIRKLFGFGDIKDNTLLAQEFNLFADVIKEDKKDNNNVGEIKNDDEPTVSNRNSLDSSVSSNTAKVSSRTRRTRNFSAIDLDSVPNIVSVGTQMSMSERAKFEAFLATGEIQMYCK